MARDLDWGDVYRDAEHERERADAGAVVDLDEDDVACEVCGEGDGPFDDVVASCWTGARNALAHVDCADANGWRLA